jgi:hypothetical protein
MKRFLKYSLLVGIAATVLSSCTMREKAVPLTPINAQINFEMADLEFIGDVTGTTTQEYFLNIPYGGRLYHQGTVLGQGGIGITVPRNRGYNNAMYDALMSQPDADLILPVSFERTVEQQFLGRKEILTVRAKAFKIKSK